jgi:hypothetical protein
MSIRARSKQLLWGIIAIEMLALVALAYLGAL